MLFIDQTIKVSKSVVVTSPLNISGKNENAKNYPPVEHDKINSRHTSQKNDFVLVGATYSRWQTT